MFIFGSLVLTKILSTLKKGFWRDFSSLLHNLYDNYSPQFTNEQNTESVWYNSNILIENIREWLENDI